MHTVLREYREARQIPLNLEHKWMQQMIADYDRLTLMQKLEVRALLLLLLCACSFVYVLRGVRL